MSSLPDPRREVSDGGGIGLEGSEVAGHLELLQTSLWKGDGGKDTFGSPQGEVRGTPEQPHPPVSSGASGSPAEKG